MRCGRLGRAALAIAAGLAAPAVGLAGPIFRPHQEPADCPPNLYSPCHYWAPALQRLHERRHGPAACFDAPDRHPDLPPRFWMIRYPCRAVDPVVITADRALAR